MEIYIYIKILLNRMKLKAPSKQWLNFVLFMFKDPPKEGDKLQRWMFKSGIFYMGIIIFFVMFILIIHMKNPATNYERLIYFITLIMYSLILNIIMWLAWRYNFALGPLPGNTREDFEPKQKRGKK